MIRWPEEKWGEMNLLQFEISEALKGVPSDHEVQRFSKKETFNEKFLDGKSWDDLEIETVLEALRKYLDVIEQVTKS